jgi:hypothetical protein
MSGYFWEGQAVPGRELRDLLAAALRPFDLVAQLDRRIPGEADGLGYVGAPGRDIEAVDPASTSSPQGSFTGLS